MFALTSRYYGIATAAFRLPDGRTVIYVRRRFLPQPEDLVQTGEHVVTAGERPDLVAAKELGDPEQAWRIADANRVSDPGDLTAQPGRRLRITLPSGLPPGGGMLAVPGSARNG
jgi:hypothetical protein